MRWPVTSLMQLVRFIGGGTPSKADPTFWSGTIPWVSPKDMNSRDIWDTQDHITEEAITASATQMVPAGSVLIVVRSGILVRSIPIGITRVPVALNQDMKALLPATANLDSEFLAYWLEARTAELLSVCVKRGATVHSLDMSKLRQLRIPLPPLSEQRRIVEILDQASALRKKRAEADAKAERILPALFIRMFGDPVTNPKGWNSKAIENVADIVGGGTPSKASPSFWTGCIPWVSPKDMRELIITDTQDHITDEAIKNSATSLVPQLSILIVFRSGILVHSVPLALAGTELTINQDMKALLPKTKELDSFYLLAWLLTSEQTLLACVKRGATVHSIDGNKFKTLSVMLPPQEMQERFSRMFREILGVEVSRRSSAKKLDSLFCLLLHHAFSGDLTAKWRVAHMEELLAEMEEQARTLNGERPDTQTQGLLFSN